MTVKSEARYESIINRFTQIQATIDSVNLKRYHEVGSIFNDFCEGAERNLYGDNTAQKLATDLQVRGILSDIKEPVRYLYWAKSIYNFDPTYEKLEELNKCGFSVSHAKMIFALPDALRDKTLKGYIASGVVPSTREESTRLRLNNVDAASKDAIAIAQETIPEVTGTVVTPPPASPAPAPDKAPEASKSEEKPAKEKKEKKDKSDEVVSPLKVINQLEKMVSKVVIAIPDAFIAIRQSEKAGFDSDKAQKNYTVMMSNLRSAINAAVEPIAELQKLLEEVKTD